MLMEKINGYYQENWGLSLRLNRLLSDSIPDNFDNIFIPGFNQKTDENKFGGGFNYTLTYNIPFASKKN